MVGDYVEFEPTDEQHGVVDSVLPRKNCLWRPPIANIDKLVIVSSYATPAPNTFIIDRIIAISEYNNIEPVIVFNKCDMGGFDEYRKIYTNAGFKTYVVSALSGDGMAELEAEIKGCTSAFTGNSGVGKSTILNCLFDNLNLQTGDVSEKLGRGRHTTRHTELYKSSYGGYVADTPGFSTIEYDGSDYAFKENLILCFRDFKKYLGNCKFTSCTHICESGCSVIEAVKNGKIEATRYKSYIELFEELKELRPWNTSKRKYK